MSRQPSDINLLNIIINKVYQLTIKRFVGSCNIIDKYVRGFLDNKKQVINKTAGWAMKFELNIFE